MSNTYNPTSDQELIHTSHTPESSAFDRIKSNVADKLRSASRTLDEKSSSIGDSNDSLSHYGQQTAKWLDKSATYIDEADTQRIKDDIQKQVRQHPGRSLLIAGAVGLFLGALLRRR